MFHDHVAVQVAATPVGLAAPQVGAFLCLAVNG